MNPGDLAECLGQPVTIQQSQRLGILHRSVSSRRPTSGVSGKPRALSEETQPHPPWLTHAPRPSVRPSLGQKASLPSLVYCMTSCQPGHSPGHATKCPAPGLRSPLTLHPMKRFKSGQVGEKILGRRESSQ
uniref:Uncharacterized protein n=1 Tax=Molossus molossus TaxID=27622 RepID=A0A7J8GQN0_MOLMO|nr:hypothetical protein HJG59_011314 [Molossus molossus]